MRTVIKCGAANDKKIFEDNWAKKWTPKVKDSELFSICGHPADEMKHAMKNPLPFESENK